MMEITMQRTIVMLTDDGSDSNSLDYDNSTRDLDENLDGVCNGDLNYANAVMTITIIVA